MTSLWDRMPHSSYTAAAEEILRSEGGEMRRDPGTASDGTARKTQEVQKTWRGADGQFVFFGGEMYQLLPRGHQWIPPHYLQVSIGHPLEALGMK